MSESGPDERLEQLNEAALVALSEFERRVQGLTGQVNALREQLDLERRQVALAVQDFQSRGRTAAGGGLVDPAAIDASERALAEQLRQVQAIQQRIGGLATIVAAGRGQLAPSGEASEGLDAMKLVARAASIRAQEAERYRLAREIHDGPAQVLANAILGLELCEQIARRTPAKVIEEITRLKSSVRDGLVEVRRFIFDLRPSTLAERGLLLTLRRYATEYANYAGVQVELQAPPELIPLGKDEEITIFRVVQEALQNVQKHARATQVTVRLAVDDAGIILVITDDGRGFSPGETDVTPWSGAGLGGMRERAAMVGGELTLGSAPGAGTTITLRVPHAGREQWQAVGSSGRGSHQ